jgi:hypothetical protein
MNGDRGRIAVVAALAAILASATAATAAAPEMTRLSFSVSSVDTETCPGIPIETQLDGQVSVTVFSEDRVQVHEHLVYTGAANGKTFTDNESFTRFVNAETGVMKLAGTAINIQIPSFGNVLADTGVIILDFSTDPPTVVHEGGPHPLFHGGFAPLCDYLAGLTRSRDSLAAETRG